jgi:hypothetical protein
MIDSITRLKQLLEDADLDETARSTILEVMSDDHRQKLEDITRNMNDTIHLFARDFFHHSRMLIGYLDTFPDIGSEEFTVEQLETLNSLENYARELYSKTEALLHCSDFSQDSTSESSDSTGSSTASSS